MEEKELNLCASVSSPSPPAVAEQARTSLHLSDCTTANGTDLPECPTSPTPTIRILESPSSLTLSTTEPVPTSKILAAHIGAALVLFLATTDATLVSTSLPTIASELQMTPTQYTWIGVAYLLTQTAFQPLYGRVSDILGRKRLLYTSMAIFSLGSLLCGLATNINMLIAFRGIAGIGGGGIVSCVWVLTSELVHPEKRAKWSQALSVTWSCSAIAGPLFGGFFSGSTTEARNSLSWRWAFLVNLPICFVGFIVLLVALRGVNLQPTTDFSLSKLLRRFDFGGLFLFMSGTSCIIVGFSFTSDLGWSSATTITSITLGVVTLVCGGIYEKYTSRECLFPAAISSDISIVILNGISFLHNFAFNAGTFYLALFFQAVNGFTPMQAGIKLLPYSLGSSLASMPTAWFIGFWHERHRNSKGQNIAISAGLALSTVGFGLMMALSEKSSSSVQIIFPLLSGIGVGMLFHAPYQVLARILKPKELASGTGAFFLVRFTGATVGLAVAAAIFNARSANRLAATLGTTSVTDYELISSIEPSSVRQGVRHIISSSVQTVWLVCSVCLGLAMLMSFALKTIPDAEEDGASDRPNLGVSGKA